MKIDIFPVPVFQGCNIRGVDLAPKKLIDSGLYEIFAKYHSVNLHDEIHFEENVSHGVFESDPNMKFKDEMLKMTTKLCSKISRSINSGNLPITIGGDHSIGTGTISGNSKSHLGNISAIWFDAHPDLNTPMTSPSKNFHGMSFAAAMGYGDESISNVGFKGAKVKTENAYLMGIRSIDKGEHELIESHNIFNLKSMDIHVIGAEEAANRLLADIESKTTDSVHFSIDVDVVNPDEMKAVNVPETCGLSLQDALLIIRRVVACPKVKSIDFVEYNPTIDKDGNSLKNCLLMLEEISKTLAERE